MLDPEQVVRRRELHRGAVRLKRLVRAGHTAEIPVQGPVLNVELLLPHRLRGFAHALRVRVQRGREGRILERFRGDLCWL